MCEKLKTLIAAVLMASLCCVPSLAQGSEADDAGAEPVAEIDEVVVVTASRTEQKLHDVPAAITVLTSEAIENMPADDFGDLLRNVPGLNVAQIGTRDVQVASRTATGSLSNGQLVLVDGRTIYLDFLGFVIWEFVPAGSDEIKQIEVVQGPGAAVWGANAMNGVINVITKSPREIDGTHLTIGGGELDTAYARITHAGVRDDFSYKFSGSYYQQDEPYERPPGLLPFGNVGTEQPKADLRLDWDRDESLFSLSFGVAGTDGIIHSGLGPFDIDSGSTMSFVKAMWSKRAMSLTGFANILDGEAANLVSVSADLTPLFLGFQSETYNVDFADTRVAGSKNIFTYGANARRNNYDLSIAPGGDDRDEFGVFVQDEILIGDRVRWLIGVRFDDIDPVGSVVSPRTSLMLSPSPDHTFRLSFNQAYRAPTLIENHLDIVLLQGITLPPLPPLLPGPTPYIFPFAAVGNPGLEEEQLDAFELGYVGTFDKATFTVSLYRNEKTDEIDFFDAIFYSSNNPPPGWPLPPFLPTPFGLIPTVPPNTLPALFTYRNVGEVINEGIELSLEVRPSQNWRINANYSFQDEPEVTGIAIEDVNIPPETRFNLGASWDGERFYVNGNVNFVDDAVWTDVLNLRGPTDSFTQVNAAFGWRWNEGQYSFGVIGSNIFDEEVQQHLFGDIISRKISGEFRFRW